MKQRKAQKPKPVQESIESKPPDFGPWDSVLPGLKKRCSEVFADATWTDARPVVNVETAVALIARCQPNESARAFVVGEVWCTLTNEIRDGNIKLLEASPEGTCRVRLRDCIDNAAVLMRYGATLAPLEGRVRRAEETIRAEKERRLAEKNRHAEEERRLADETRRAEESRRFAKEVVEEARKQKRQEDLRLANDAKQEALTRLTKKRRAVLDLIPCDDGDRKGLKGADILNALAMQGCEVEQSELTSHIIPILKKHHGVYNKRDGTGYLRKC